MKTKDRSVPWFGGALKLTVSNGGRGPLLVLFACVWAVSISVPLGLFSASHMAALPVAEEVAVDSGEVAGEWRIVHVLAEECACSRSVIEYLLDRGSAGEMQEDVVLLDGSRELVSRLRSGGFRVTTVEAEDFCESLGSEGVPFFQVVEGGESPRYSGAYFDSAFRATSGFLDLKTYSLIKDGGFVLSRPVFGCATSERLKSLLDPLGLKY